MPKAIIFLYKLFLKKQAEVMKDISYQSKQNNYFIRKILLMLDPKTHIYKPNSLYIVYIENDEVKLKPGPDFYVNDLIQVSHYINLKYFSLAEK